MPTAKSTKCKTCDESITKTQGSVMCKACSRWLHTSCANISDKDFLVLKTVKSFSFICSSCEPSLNTAVNIGERLDTFLKSYQAEQIAFKAVLDDIKSEMTSCLAEIKSDVKNCNERVDRLEASSSTKFAALEAEDNVMHRKFNRSDFIISGLPEGLNDLEAPVIALGTFFNTTVTSQDISHVCYINRRKQILVKLSKVSKRDSIMKEYFKTRTLKVCDILDGPGGDINSRVYLNDHYTPAAGAFNVMCRKLRRLNIVSKFKILNTDKLKAKLTLPDGKEVIRDVNECALLLKDANVDG